MHLQPGVAGSLLQKTLKVSGLVHLLYQVTVASPVENVTFEGFPSAGAPSWSLMSKLELGDFGEKLVLSSE